MPRANPQFPSASRTAAAPIARKVLARYFGIPDDDEAALKRVAGFVPLHDQYGAEIRLSALDDPDAAGVDADADQHGDD